jgi:hypothetical protein
MNFPDDQYLQQESADGSSGTLHLEDEIFQNIFVTVIAALIVAILSIISIGLSRLFHKKHAKDVTHAT